MRQRKRNRAGGFCAGLAIFTIAASIVILYILCLTGSTYTNAHVPQIFIAQIQNSSLSIVMGFYGICTDSSAPNTTTTCAPTISRSATAIAAILFPAQDQPASAANTTTSAANTTTSLISLALDLQRNILLSPLPVAAGLFLLSLFLTLLTRMIASRQRHLMPPTSRRLRWLHIVTLSIVWLSTSLALTAAVLASEMINGLVYIIGALEDGDGDGNKEGRLGMSAGGLLQVLLWVIVGLSVVFAGVEMRVLKVGEGGGRGKRVDFEKGWKDFENEHVITI